MKFLYCLHCDINTYIFYGSSSTLNFQILRNLNLFLVCEYFVNFFVIFYKFAFYTYLLSTIVNNSVVICEVLCTRKQKNLIKIKNLLNYLRYCKFFMQIF